MERRRSAVLLAVTGVVCAGLVACARADTEPVADADGGFAELQARGEEAMGVDQYTSSHVFDALEDGGRIELQRDVDDPDGVAQIRQHLQEIAQAFRAGDFSTPAFVHMQTVPGTTVMAAKRDLITYSYSELPRGGELRIVTRDPEAARAIHEFMAFQRDDHRAGGAHGAMHGAGHDHDDGHEHDDSHDHDAGHDHEAGHDHDAGR